MYNKDLLKKVGYDSIPATWDEFLTMCGKLKAAGITPYLEPKDGLGNAVEGWIGAESAKQGEALDAKIDAGKDTFKNVYGKYYGEWDKLIKQNLMSSDVSGQRQPGQVGIHRRTSCGLSFRLVGHRQLQ